MTKEEKLYLVEKTIVAENKTSYITCNENGLVENINPFEMSYLNYKQARELLERLKASQTAEEKAQVQYRAAVATQCIRNYGWYVITEVLPYEEAVEDEVFKAGVGTIIVPEKPVKAKKQPTNEEIDTFLAEAAQADAEREGLLGAAAEAEKEEVE